MTDNETILLVDDDEGFTEIMSRTLTRRGYDVSVANCISDAITLLEAHSFDNAVIDLRIGQESGLEMVDQVLQRQPDVNIVVLTGYASIATAVEAIKLGARQYLTKPAEVDEIIAGFSHTEGDKEVEVAENPMSVKRLEWEHLQKVLKEHDGNISAAARALDMHRRTLQRKLQKRPVKQ